MPWARWIVPAFALNAYFALFSSVFPPALLAFSLFLLLLILAFGSYALCAQAFVRVRCSFDPPRNEIALTFDDGPDPRSTPQVLDLLSRYQAQATFFLVADKAAKYPELVARIFRDGHEIALHGKDHKWTSLLTTDRALRLVFGGDVKLRAVLRDAVGEDKALRYFRPPYGVSTPALGQVMSTSDLSVVGWSIRPKDGTGKGDPGDRAAWILERLRPGAIILLHDSPRQPGAIMPLGPALLPILLEGLKTEGYSSIKLSEAFAKDETEN